jgi:hypothetical protein
MSKAKSKIYEKHNIVDFDIHGLVGIRLINPSESDAIAVGRQLGPLNGGTLKRKPDIIIRFKKKLPLHKLKYLGLNEIGYNADGFYILNIKKSAARIRIPFESIGDRCEIECETGLPAIPQLISIVNMTLLKKDYIALHASAFDYKDKGILVTGWSKGGKTEALMGFLIKGARYVGDEWVILTKDGQSMYGIPEPITLWDWQIKQLPDICPMLTSSDRLIFKTIHFIGKMHSFFSRGIFKNTLPVKILKKAMPNLINQLHVNFPPQKIVKRKNMQLYAAPDTVFFVMSHKAPNICIEPWNSEDIARRMLYSLQYEQRLFFSYYQAFKFAFPDLQNHFLENAPTIQKILLSQALNGKKAYRVMHPYPVSLDSLFRHMKPFCERN